MPVARCICADGRRPQGSRRRAPSICSTHPLPCFREDENSFMAYKGGRSDCTGAALRPRKSPPACLEPVARLQVRGGRLEMAGTATLSWPETMRPVGVADAARARIDPSRAPRDESAAARESRPASTAGGRGGALRARPRGQSGAGHPRTGCGRTFDLRFAAAGTGRRAGPRRPPRSFPIACPSSRCPSNGRRPSWSRSISRATAPTA